MAKIDYIKLSKPRNDGKSELLVRLYVSKSFRPQFKSGLFISPQRFIPLDTTNRCRRYEIDVPREGTQNFSEIKEIKEVKRKFALYLERLQAICDVTSEKHRDELTTEWFNTSINLINKDNTNIEDISYQYIVHLIEEEQRTIEEERIKANKRSFFDCMYDFRNNSKKKTNGKREGNKSNVWKINFDVLISALQRYEMFIGQTDKKRKGFALDIDTIDHETLEDIESYLRNEHALIEEYPAMFQMIFAATATKRKTPKAHPKGNNTISALFKKLKAFFSWLNEKRITTNNPFIGYEGIVTEKYGTPFYITLEERNKIADYDLSEYPYLAIQRDVFVFQCCIGCRVSDLFRLTAANVIDNAIEYIPRKTKEERQTVVRVPLNKRASTLINKYKGVDTQNRLFPFVSLQSYNNYIKEIFLLCGITRSVTVVDSVTGKEVQRPINEIASSHMARRSFVGNLYKKVKDPNLIASMSGHVEGSQAFTRYRDIDEDLKKEVIKLID